MIAIRNSHNYIFPLFEVEQVSFDHDFDIQKFTIGIDPGTAHLGIVFLAPNCQGMADEVTMKRDNEMTKRIARTQDVLRQLTYFLPTDAEMNVIIEGPAFSDRFRQAELAEQRAAIAIWLWEHFNVSTYVVAPSKIYKQVFGTGKARAWEVWSELPHNAASALAVAIYPLYEKEDKHEQQLL